MSRLPHRNSQPPAPQPAHKPKRSRQAVETAKEDRQYAKHIETYREYNPNCAGCGGPFESFHHIARGPDRRRTLINTDLGMGACQECHEKWDDKGKTPVAKQFAVKFCAALRRYEEITRKRVSINEVVAAMEAIKQ